MSSLFVKASPVVQGLLTLENTAILGMRFSSKTIVDGVIEKLKSEVLGLHLKLKNDRMYMRKDDITVYKLPNQKGMNLKDITNIAAKQFPPNLQKELGIIAANDDTVVVMINHAVADGKYIVGIAEHIGDKTKKLDRFFPFTYEKEFKEQLEQREKLPPNHFKNSPYNTKYILPPDVEPGLSMINEEIFDMKSLTCYDKNTQKCHGLTPAIVAGFLLSVNAIQNKNNFNVLGGSMASNIRGELPTKPTLRHANIFTVVSMGANVSPNTTLSECHKSLANSLKEHFKNKSSLYDYINAFYHPEIFSQIPPNDGIMTCFSQLGPVQVSPPAEDVYITNICYNLRNLPTFPLLTYSVINEQTGKNELHSQFVYNSNGISKKKASILNASLRHYLQNFQGNDTIKDALQDLKSFQNSLNK